MKIKITKKDKKNLAKAIKRELKEDNKIAKILKENKGKLELKVKTSLFVGKDKKKHFGGCVELIETKSDTKILDGWNLDLGLTEDFDMMAGISKDIYLAGEEFSLGGYVNVKSAYEKLFKKSDEKIKLKVGISKVF